MTSETKITEWTCEHPERFALGNAQFFWTFEYSSVEDREFVHNYAAKRVSMDTPGADTFPRYLCRVQLCCDCYMALPSEVVKRRQAQDRLYAAPKGAGDSEVNGSERQEILDRIEAGESLYLCNGCNEFKDEDDLVPLRECPHCDETYDGKEGRNCPSCNRPFTRKLADMACPDCLDPDSLPEPATIEMVAA